MLLGEITPGGVGAGLYGMLIVGAITAVFIAGLMVGRTPEYLGKKVEAYEMKMAMLTILVLGASVLGFTALATAIPEGQAGPLNHGPHGFSEILYAFASQTGNNGSAFAGLTGDTPFYDVVGGLAMLIGRFGMIIPVLAVAGSMAAKRAVAPSLGTFPTNGALWSVLLVGVVVVVGALTYFPALALGPIVEQLLQAAGHAF
jgi:K+-transporting ATPase ATPase A chain